jgi:hypothetical protein
MKTLKKILASRQAKEKTSWQLKHLSGPYKGKTFYHPSLAAARLEACWQADFNDVVTAIYPPQYGDQ